MLKLKLDRILAVALGMLWLGAALEDSPPLRADQAPPPYDPRSVKTVEGTVDKVESYAPAGGTDFTRVILKTKGGTLALLLGPIEYLAKNQLALAVGDRVVVTGSDVGEGRSEIMLVQQVQKGDEIWILRNGRGVPLWSIRPASSQAEGALTNPAFGPAKPGYAIFTQQCGMCHNAYSTQTKVGPGLKGLYYRAKLVNGQAVNDDNLRDYLKASHTGMPSFANALDAKQINQLIAYLRRL